MLPRRATIARDMGFWGMAITVPQVLAPVIGGLVLLPQHAGPTVAYERVFGFTDLFALAGSLLVWQVRGVR